MRKGGEEQIRGREERRTRGGEREKEREKRRKFADHVHALLVW